MANRCDGLPLAIITVARSMKGVDDIYEWRDALEELKRSIMRQNDMKDKVFPILSYSYSRLKDKRLQECFLYCSMYPEDYKIPIDELIAQFIYEGVMQQRDTRTSEFIQGHTILNKLVKSCLLEMGDYEKDERWVKMHDLLREMAIEITRNSPRHMIKAGVHLCEIPDEKEWTEDLGKVSLMKNRIVKIPRELSPKCLRLSTLILSDNPLMFIPDSFFTHMHDLRVLNLRNTWIKELPSSISELENLNALLLGRCHRLFYVPPLGKLKALTELDLSWTTIEELPAGMKCLVKLKYLDMRGMEKLAKIPSWLFSQSSCFQCLFLPDHIEVQVEEIESLKMLEEFDGRANDFCNSHWFNKSTFYHITIGNNRHAYVVNNCKFVIELIGYPFKKREVDVQLELPRNIQYLTIENCENLSGCLLDVFPSLANYRALQNLQHLMLIGLANLIGLIKWEPRALAVVSHDIFSSLRSLEIYRCPKIKKLFQRKLLLHNLQNLEEIFIDDCDQMEEIITEDEEDDSAGSSSSPTNIITLPKLRRIILESLPKLESIYKGTINCCDSIMYIRIVGCTQLSRLPFFLPYINGRPSPPSSLKWISIIEEEKDWWENLKWDDPNCKIVLRPFLYLKNSRTEDDIIYDELTKIVKTTFLRSLPEDHFYRARYEFYKQPFIFKGRYVFFEQPII